MKVPEGWEVKRLGEIADITRGASPRPIQKFLTDNGIPWVKISDATATDSRYITKTREFIKEEGKSKSVYVVPGDLIVSNSGTPGLPRIMKIEACIHDGWLLLRNLRKIKKEFLYYLLLHERKKLVRKGNGTVFTNLKTDILKNYEIRLPPLPEQQKIAEILGSIDDQIENLMEQNKTLEEIAKTIFKRWFIDFEFPNEEGKPYKSSGGEFVDSELGKIPKGWRVGKLGEYIDIVKGLSYKGKYLVENSDVILVNLKNVSTDGIFRIDGIKFYRGDYKEKHIVKSGDVVLAVTDLTRKGDILANPVIIPEFKDKTLIISMDLAKIKFNNDCWKWYIFYLMKTFNFKAFAKANASGTTVLHLKVEKLKDYELFLLYCSPIKWDIIKV
jgi:type I restriction enzyme S subunit